MSDTARAIAYLLAVVTMIAAVPVLVWMQWPLVEECVADGRSWVSCMLWVLW